MNKIFASSSAWGKNGLAILRIITGLLMTYHGWEIFSTATMQEYLKWDVVKSLPSPKTLVYAGKGLELITGICLTVGLFTRLSALFMAIDMLFICFKIGGGKFYYEDQHPFIFAMLALVFFFTGAVKWDLDKLFFKK